MRIHRSLLILGGKQDQPVSNVWPYPLPVDPLARANEFSTLANIPGVDVYEAAITAGYDEPTAKRMAGSADRTLIPDEPETLQNA